MGVLSVSEGDSLPGTPLLSPDFDPRCYCGCTHSAVESGEIVASGRCKGLATWIIKTAAMHRVSLTFRYYAISHEKQWVKVRDGETEEAELLFFSGDLSEPADVTSSSSAMRVELMTQRVMTSPAELAVFPISATLPIHVHGFIASFSMTAAPATADSPPTLFRRKETSVLKSDITIVGISVVGVVVVVATVVVVVVVKRRNCWGRRVTKFSVSGKSEEGASPYHSHFHHGGAGSSGPRSHGSSGDIDVHRKVPGGRGKGQLSSDQRTASKASTLSSMYYYTGLKKACSAPDPATAITSTHRHTQQPGGEGWTRDYAGSAVRPSSRVYAEVRHHHHHYRHAKKSSLDQPDVFPDFHTGFQARDPAEGPEPGHSHQRLKAYPRDSPGGGPVLPASVIATRREESKRRKQQHRHCRRKKKGDSHGHAERLGGDPADVTGYLVDSPATTIPSAVTSTSTTTVTTTTIQAEINLTKPSFASGQLWLHPDVTNPSSKSKSRTGSARLSRRAMAAKRHSQVDKTSGPEQAPLMDLAGQVHSHQLQRDSQSHTPPVREEISYVNHRKTRTEPSLTETNSSNTTDLEPTRNTPVRNVKITQLGHDESLFPKEERQSHPCKCHLGHHESPFSKEERQSLLYKPQSPILRSAKGEDKQTDGRGSRFSSPRKSDLSSQSSKTFTPAARTVAVTSRDLEYDDFAVDDQQQSSVQHQDISRHC